MLKKNIFYKIILILFVLIGNVYSCPVYENPTPIADTYVNIDAKKLKTSFNITWKFKEFYIESLLEEHDRNKNGKFDKDEQDDIKHELIAYVEKNNYITEVAYTKKGQRAKKSLLSELKVIESGLIFSDDGIKYYYKFDTNFVIEENHRLFIRFLDPKEKVQLNLKDIVISNYSGKKVVKPQDIRANIYFYDHKKKDIRASITEANKHNSL